MKSGNKLILGVEWDYLILQQTGDWHSNYSSKRRRSSFLGQRQKDFLRLRWIVTPCISSSSKKKSDVITCVTSIIIWNSKGNPNLYLNASLVFPMEYRLFTFWLSFWPMWGKRAVCMVVSKNSNKLIIQERKSMECDPREKHVHDFGETPYRLHYFSFNSNNSTFPKRWKGGNLK